MRTSSPIASIAAMKSCNESRDTSDQKRKIMHRTPIETANCLTHSAAGRSCTRVAIETKNCLTQRRKVAKPQRRIHRIPDTHNHMYRQHNHSPSTRVSNDPKRRVLTPCDLATLRLCALASGFCTCVAVAVGLAVAPSVAVAVERAIAPARTALVPLGAHSVHATPTWIAAMPNDSGVQVTSRNPAAVMRDARSSSTGKCATLFGR